ncbi:MAG: fibronectin type III domain-containing protein [Solirubrobacterales bacterium]|nr:fibronectin type III domain-containing protein [Solirubrobacterales bacterium]
MKRVLKIAVLVGILTAGLAGLAVAASSPTVITGGAAKITGSAAVLNGRVNPNGAPTGYLFQYGTTTSLGADSPSRSAGSGKAENVSEGIGGLIPGTVYYYRITAVSTAGATNGAIRHFTTAGFPPPGAVTGPAIDVGMTVATPTGVISPNGAPTAWVVRYGLTANYGMTVVGALLPASRIATPVSLELMGLAPATLFHYQIVAYHGGIASPGADATFFTEPARRPRPTLSTRTSPSFHRKSPYTFTTRGTLKGGNYIPAAQRCTGKVGVRFYNGRRQLGVSVAPVGGDCRFSAQTSFRRTHARGPAHLRVTISFRGNGYLAPVNHVDHVTAG